LAGTIQVKLPPVALVVSVAIGVAAALDYLWRIGQVSMEYTLRFRLRENSGDGDGSGPQVE